MLLAFIWIILKYRQKKLVFLAAFNLLLMAFQAWFGSIVVASNLVPWTITVHMFLALAIIGIQLYLLYQISSLKRTSLVHPKWILVLIWFCFLVVFYQMFLGTQVRESIDMLTRQGIGRESWTNELGLPFYIHRSFSWLVLLILTLIAWKNERLHKFRPIRFVFLILVMELISGVLLVHADMPGLVQTSHLVFATIIFGILLMILFRSKTGVHGSAI